MQLHGWHNSLAPCSCRHFNLPLKGRHHWLVMGWSEKLSSLSFTWNKFRRNTVFHYLIYELQVLGRSSYPWDALKRDCSYPAIRQKLMEPAIPWPPESLMFHTVRICWIPLLESFCCCCWNHKFTNVILVTPLSNNLICCSLIPLLFLLSQGVAEGKWFPFSVQPPFI